ncbi:MAG TPA: DinB family protein [Pyrinomonadaceae bacterium]|nr:DinB family protein [Pyrinomonadaceae bacterium]
MDTDFANIAGMYKTNTDIVGKTISEVSDERWFDKPGDDSNHLMWVVGHLVWSRWNVLKLLGQEWDIPAARLFERGATVANQDEYPTVEAMKTAWAGVSGKLAATLADASDETLSKSAPKGPPTFDGKLSGVVAFLAFHETYHVGQVSYLKKWLGYGQAVG